MTSTVLLTLGRLPKALEIARAFASAGWRVVIAEPFAWHVSRLSSAVDQSRIVTAPAVDRAKYLDDLLKIISEERIDVVVPVSEETIHVAALHDRLPPSVRLFCPSQSSLLQLHDKFAFIRRAEWHGLPVPKTFRADTGEAAALASAKPHVIKPIFSCSGKGVTINTSAQALTAEHRSSKMIVQEFVPGQVLSSFSIADKGRRVVTALYKGTIMSGTVSVAFQRVDDATAAHGWIDDFIAAEHYTGFISFDLVMENSGRVSAIECNPRATSGVHFLDERDLVAAMISPQTAPPVRFKSQARFQQFYPCLTETQKSVFRRTGAKQNLTNLLSSRDVVWRARDPLPFLFMPATSYQILGMSIFEGLSFGEAATRDIEWTEPN